ncbi:MAG: galactose ABC transporter substrate-binding protein [Eubacteriales bacterium]|nr:galactose ABC transporter substrate-binding protein [Eubacteriales bacterium]
MKKKIVTLFLSAMMATSMLAVPAMADDATDAEAVAEEATDEAEEEAAEDVEEDAAEAAEDAADAIDLEGIDVENATIGISIYKFDDNFMTLYRTELVRYLTEDLGFNEKNITVTDGKNDQAEQTNQINNFITAGVDVMILNLVQSSSAPQVTDLCNEAGIPVVYINRQPEESESDRWAEEGIKATYVGADARQSGTFQGEEILETANGGDINGDGKVSYIMVQGDPENIDAQYRTEYSVKALTDAGVEVEELLLQRGDWDQAKGQQIVQDALTQFGDQIEVVFCNNDAMALGALQSIQAAGRVVNEDIYLVGVDALTDALQNIQDGNMTGTVFNDHIGQSHAAVEMAVKFLKDEEVAPVNMVDYIKATSENAADILALLQ